MNKLFNPLLTPGTGISDPSPGLHLGSISFLFAGGYCGIQATNVTQTVTANGINRFKILIGFPSLGQSAFIPRTEARATTWELFVDTAEIGSKK